MTDRSLRAVLTVTVETRPGGDYYVDHGDFVRHVIPWIEGGLNDRDDIVKVTITEQPAPVDRIAVLPVVGVFATLVRQRADHLEAAHARMRDQLEVTHVRVRKLHTPGESGECQDCHHGHPCPTVQVLDGDLRRTADGKSATASEPGTLAAWLYSRFANALDAPAWDLLTEADRAYWEHQARAVRRAVARGGFKAAGAQT